MDGKLLALFLFFIFNFSLFAKEPLSVIDQNTFNNLIDHFEAVFAPIIAAKSNKKLIIKRDWESDRINAHATKDFDNNLLITIEGGMARHFEASPDGLWMVLCHELGHYYGGAPKQFRGDSELRSWSSAEGQADYYAATKCFPKLLEHQSEIGQKLQKQIDQMLAARPKSNDELKSNLPDDVEVSFALRKCNSDLCIRMSLAGLSMGRIFASLREGNIWPTLSKEDGFQVLRTITSHPSPQCRVDTIVSAANCKQDSAVDFDPENPRIGACKDGEVGARPLCWYSPDI